MSNEDIRYKRSQKMKKNYLAKALRQQKQFQPKVIDGRKEEYRRIKINPREVDDNEGLYNEFKTDGEND